RTVSLALGKAEQLRDQAAALPVATSREAEAALVVWRQAEDTLAQADAALATGAADDALRQRAAAEGAQGGAGRQQTEPTRARSVREEALVRGLDEARMARVRSIGGDFDYAGAAARYRAAFAAYGLEVQPGGTAELARRLRAEEPAVYEALLVALDDWIYAVG